MLHDAEPLEHHERVIVEDEGRVAERRAQVLQVAVPEPLVCHPEFVRVGVALALVDRVAVIDIRRSRPRVCTELVHISYAR